MVTALVPVLRLRLRLRPTLRFPTGWPAGQGAGRGRASPRHRSGRRLVVVIVLANGHGGPGRAGALQLRLADVLRALRGAGGAHRHQRVPAAGGGCRWGPSSMDVGRLHPRGHARHLARGGVAGWRGRAGLAAVQPPSSRCPPAGADTFAAFAPDWSATACPLTCPGYFSPGPEPGGGGGPGRPAGWWSSRRTWSRWRWWRTGGWCPCWAWATPSA